MTELVEMLDEVILQLERKIQTEEHPRMLQRIYGKYTAAKTELETTGHIKTNLIGGTRAYMDSYGDYGDNPLMAAMHKVEMYIKAQR